MIYGAAWTVDLAARAVLIAAPPGHRILLALETTLGGDLQWRGASWEPVRQETAGRLAGSLPAFARQGSGVAATWILPDRGDQWSLHRRSFRREASPQFPSVSAIDRQALEEVARTGSLAVAPGLCWECTSCGHVYPKGSPHQCAEGLAS